MKTKIIVSASVIVIMMILGVVVYLNNRSTIPEGAVPVKAFNLKNYMGKWYEIARLDFVFEKGLDNVTAEYTLNEDGTVKVVNTGYNYEKNKVEVATGKAKLAGAPDEAKLKVKFGGPVYAGYNVIAIDEDYKYALVVGRNLNYMWLLSRETSMPENIQKDYLQKAKDLGYKVEDLVWTKQSEQN